MFTWVNNTKRYSKKAQCFWVLGRCVAFTILSVRYQYLPEGADRVGALLRGNKECPFSGVTKSGRVWRKVPESDARSGGRYIYTL